MSEKAEELKIADTKRSCVICTCGRTLKIKSKFSDKIFVQGHTCSMTYRKEEKEEER